MMVKRNFFIYSLLFLAGTNYGLDTSQEASAVALAQKIGEVVVSKLQERDDQIETLLAERKREMEALENIQEVNAYGAIKLLLQDIRVSKVKRSLSEKDLQNCKNTGKNLAHELAGQLQLIERQQDIIRQLQAQIADLQTYETELSQQLAQHYDPANFDYVALRGKEAFEQNLFPVFMKTIIEERKRLIAEKNRAEQKMCELTLTDIDTSKDTSDHFARLSQQLSLQNELLKKKSEEHTQERVALEARVADLTSRLDVLQTSAASLSPASIALDLRSDEAPQFPPVKPLDPAPQPKKRSRFLTTGLVGTGVALGAAGALFTERLLTRNPELVEKIAGAFSK